MFVLPTLRLDTNFVPDSTGSLEVQRCPRCSVVCGFAAFVDFGSRRQALSSLLCSMAGSALPKETLIYPGQARWCSALAPRMIEA